MRQHVALSRFLVGLFVAVAAGEADAQGGSTPFLEEALAEVRVMGAYFGVTLREELGEGMYLETTPKGGIRIGRGFLERISKSVPPELQRLFLSFALAHEAWHVKQMSLYGDALGASRKARSLSECQADIMAAATVTTRLLSPDVLAMERIVESSRKLLQQVRELLPVLSSFVEPESEKHGHLSKFQRVMAYNFGTWRAVADGDLATREPRLKPLTEQHARLAGGIAEPRPEWSRKQCLMLLRHEDTISGQVYELPVGMKSDKEDGRRIWTHTLKYLNVGGRPIRVSMRMFSGAFPKDQEGAYEKYVFADGASAEVDVPPGGEGVLSGRLRSFSGGGERSESFTWSLGGLTETPRAITFIGEIPRASSCNDGWINLDRTEDDRVLSGLARLGSSAARQFDDVIGAQRNAFAFASTIEIPGAEISIFRGGGGPQFTAVSFYQGESETDGRREFNRIASLLKTRCTVPGVTISESSRKGGTPELELSRLTASSSARLTISKVSKTQSTDDVRETSLYAVTLFITVRE
jgi:hypothetical protein